MLQRVRDSGALSILAPSCNRNSVPGHAICPVEAASPKETVMSMPATLDPQEQPSEPEPEAAIDDLELAALLASRICHDIINPVAAIANGLEMLNEDPDEGMRQASLDLIGTSAAQASAKLQFARLAYGAAGSSGASIDTRDAEKVAAAFVACSDKHEIFWDGPALILPKNKVKLLLNMVALGVSALPRGGTLRVSISGDEPDVAFAVTARGKAAKLNDGAARVLGGVTPAEIDSHAILPYYAARLAAAAGLTVTLQTGEDEVVLEAA